MNGLFFWKPTTLCSDVFLPTKSSSSLTSRTLLEGPLVAGRPGVTASPPVSVPAASAAFVATAGGGPVVSVCGWHPSDPCHWTALRYAMASAEPPKAAAKSLLGLRRGNDVAADAS